MPPPPAAAVVTRSSVDPSELRSSEAHLQSLHTAVEELSRPVPLHRIAAIVAHAAIDALDPRAVVVAVHEDDGLHLRGVHVAGLPEQARRRLCTQSAAAPRLVAELERFCAGAAGGAAKLAALPIDQGGRALGLLILSPPHDRPFSDDDHKFLNVLTCLCALAIDRLLMHAERSRVRAVLRRYPIGPEPAGARLRVGDMEIYLEEQRVTIGSHVEVALTPCELRLLVFLAEYPGRPRSRREILQHLWHTEHVGDERACDVHVSNLRRKIERDPSRPERLTTLRGYGYALLPR